jgi:hypothetical protein
MRVIRCDVPQHETTQLSSLVAHRVYVEKGMVSRTNTKMN